MLPPQPKKLPSFEAPGDLGNCLCILKIAFVSLGPFPEAALLEMSRCGGVGLGENMDSIPVSFGVSFGGAEV